jgi:hypothetical protein
MSIKVLAGGISVLLVMTGCTIMQASIPGVGAPLDGLKTQATYDVIGPAKGTATGITLFGFIPLWGWFEVKSGTIASEGFQRPVVGLAANATYNAIASVPTADTIIAPRWIAKTDNYIIYQKRTVTLEGKAVRLNQSVK